MFHPTVLQYIMKGCPQFWKNSKLGHEGNSDELVYHCSTCGLVCFHTHAELDVQFTHKSMHWKVCKEFIKINTYLMAFTLLLLLKL